MSLQNFVEQVPKNEYMDTKVFKWEKIILFRPKKFLSGVNVFFEDFHFSLPTMTPPPIIIGKKEYQFKKERLLVFNPWTESIVTKDAPCKEYLAFSVNREFLQETSREMTGKRLTSTAKPEYAFSSQLIKCLNSFQYEIDNFDNQCPIMIQSISLQLVIQLIRDINNNSSNGNIPIPDGSYIKKAIEYMEAYYDANISIDDICKAIYLSPYHFIRMFKEKVGMTPHEYLLSIRLHKVKELLEKGECTISESAKLCGFVNQSHFSTVFKNYVGIPPSIYKKKHFIMKNSD